MDRNFTFRLMTDVDSHDIFVNANDEAFDDHTFFYCRAFFKLTK